MWHMSIVILLSASFLKYAHNENVLSEIQLSLPNAARHCSEQGLILESDETVIQDSVTVHQDVWIGRYEAFTDWAYIKGCVKIQIDPRSKPLNVTNGTERNICQGLCKENRYFGVKNKFCICLDTISIFPKCKCNLNDCVIIWEHHHPANVQDIDRKCIAVQNCNENKEVVRIYVQCDLSFLTECDDGSKADYYLINHNESESFCRSEGSFIKWYNESICSVWHFTVPEHWTSGRRYNFTDIVRKNDIIQPHQLLSCHSINKNGEIRTYNADACKTNQFYFLCRNESSIDVLKLAIIYPPETTENESSTGNSINDLKPATIYPPENESSTGSSVGVIIGTVTAGVLFAVLAVLIVIFIKRRYDKVDEDSDRYDDLSPNLRAGEADYQTIQLRADNHKNNANDHVETRQ